MMAKGGDPHLLRLREALADTSAYGNMNWENAEIGQATDSKRGKVWRLTITNTHGQPETYDFTDDDFHDNQRLRDKILKGRAGPTTSNPRLDDPENQKK